MEAGASETFFYLPYGSLEALLDAAGRTSLDPDRHIVRVYRVADVL